MMPWCIFDLISRCLYIIQSLFYIVNAFDSNWSDFCGSMSTRNHRWYTRMTKEDRHPGHRWGTRTSGEVARVGNGSTTPTNGRANMSYSSFQRNYSLRISESPKPSELLQCTVGLYNCYISWWKPQFFSPQLGVAEVFQGKAPDAAVVPHRRGGDSDDLTMAGSQTCGISMAGGWWMFIAMVW